VSDFLVNYYLESGSVVHFYPFNTFTNNISGNGTVAFVDIGDISDNTTNNIQVCNILCSDFQFITTCGQAFGVYYNIYCDTCEGDCFAPAIPEPYEYLNVYCKSTANLQGLGENESAVGIKLYAANIILSDPYSLGYGLSTNSLLSAKTAYLTNVNFSVSTGAGGFVWDVGKTYCNGVDPNFPAGMIFIGNPSFDHSITAPNCIGSYQVNGVQYGNGGGLTNIPSTSITGGMTTNIQFTDTALLRTNTLYFTNGILMRVTSP
jgi:hypothetical protein